MATMRIELLYSHSYEWISYDIVATACNSHEARYLYAITKTSDAKYLFYIFGCVHTAYRSNNKLGIYY